MTTYYSNRVGSSDHKIPANRPQSGSTWEDRGTYTAATLASGSVIEMVRVPPNVRVTDVQVRHAGSANTTIKVGDGNSTARFIPATNTDQTSANAGGPLRMNGLTYKYTDYDTIDITTGGLGTFTGQIELIARGVVATAAES